MVRCGVAAPCPPAPPCTPGSWAAPLPGYIGAGGDVAPAAPHTLVDAQALCARTAGCLGLTFAANESAPAGIIPNVFFKDSADETEASGWWTYELCVGRGGN